MELDQCVSLFTKPSFKWIKHLNVKPETMKVQGENIDSRLEDKGVEKDILNWTCLHKTKASYWQGCKKCVLRKREQLLGFQTPSPNTDIDR